MHIALFSFPASVWESHMCHCTY